MVLDRRARRAVSRANANSLILVVSLTQIVVSRTRRGALGHAGEGIELLLAHGDDAAIGAHSDGVEALVAGRIHPVPAFELCCDAIDRALDAEGLAASHAKCGLFFLDHLRRRPGRAEVDLRLERDYLFGTGTLTQSALHAGVFDEFEDRTLRIVAKCPGGADRNTGQAQRTAVGVDADGANRCAFGQGNHVSRARGEAVAIA